MKAFAIRQKSTGFYLPAGKHVRCGYTHDEPEANGGAKGPRLFHSWKAADRARYAWLQGIWRPVYDRSTDWFGDSEYMGVEPEPKPGRNKDDMEVVEFDLIERNAS